MLILFNLKLNVVEILILLFCFLVIFFHFFLVSPYCPFIYLFLSLNNHECLRNFHLLSSLLFFCVASSFTLHSFIIVCWHSFHFVISCVYLSTSLSHLIRSFFLYSFSLLSVYHLSLFFVFLFFIFCVFLFSLFNLLHVFFPCCFLLLFLLLLSFRIRLKGILPSSPWQDHSENNYSFPFRLYSVFFCNNLEQNVMQSYLDPREYGWNPHIFFFTFNLYINLFFVICKLKLLCLKEEKTMVVTHRKCKIERGYLRGLVSRPQMESSTVIWRGSSPCPPPIWTKSWVPRFWHCIEEKGNGMKEGRKERREGKKGRKRRPGEDQGVGKSVVKEERRI